MGRSFNNLMNNIINFTINKNINNIQYNMLFIKDIIIGIVKMEVK